MSEPTLHWLIPGILSKRVVGITPVIVHERNKKLIRYSVFENGECGPELRLRKSGRIFATYTEARQALVDRMEYQVSQARKELHAAKYRAKLARALRKPEAELQTHNPIGVLAVVGDGRGNQETESEGTKLPVTC